ncbi:MAG TPA: bifunctional DNA primase/polymerase [Terriglobales bacterium]|nr:bifunctional DNA primase/polymerase [Terriglobales bacterium]
MLRWTGAGGHGKFPAAESTVAPAPKIATPPSDVRAERPPSRPVGPVYDSPQLLNAALGYAERGWHVVPLHNPTGRGCSCGHADCASPAKHPRTVHGLKDASHNPATIRQWWAQWKDANVGITTGPESGIIVLDVDGKQGEESLVELERRYGALPDTFTVRTGGGGLHSYFTHPPGLDVRNSASKIAPGLDVRGAGGYVVAPPSLHSSGQRYEVNESAIPPVPCPEWLLSLIQSANGTQARQDAPAAGAVGGAIGKGGRTKRLVSLAGGMLRRGMTPEAIEAALLAENAARCSPPLPEAKVRAIAHDIPARYPNPAPSTPPHDEETTAAGTPDWPALPAAALYGLAGDIVRTIEPHSEADPTALLIQALTAVGNLIGPELHCIVESTRHALTLCPVLVGETSKGRKGTSWSHIERLGARVDPKWTAERITGGLSSAEGLISEVRDDPEIDRRLLVIQPEYGSVLRIMAREGNALSPLLRSAWDSGNLRTLVKHNPLKATSAHISVIGHITRLELLRYLSDTEQHNGFANRLLWCCVRRSKCLPEGGSVPEAEIAPLAQVLTSVVEWARQKGDCEIRRDETARGLWAAVYPRLSAGRAGLLGAATSRAEAQVLRLSAIYAVLDCSAVIRVEHLRAALGVWEYCLASARFIFGNAIGDPVADRIREALTDAGEAGLTRTQIRDLLGRHASADRIAQALTQLVALGIATRSTVSTEGRSIELWTATEATKATEG